MLFCIFPIWKGTKKITFLLSFVLIFVFELFQVTSATYQSRNVLEKKNLNIDLATN